MRKVLWTALFFFVSISAFNQSFYQKPLNEVLVLAKSNSCIAVEGYYVDNSSFMVTHSSDAIIKEDTRYPVYEYKYQQDLYNKKRNQMTEVPVFSKKDMQGKSRSRILLLNKKRTSEVQLVVDELAIHGMSIVGDTVKYVQTSENKLYTTPLSDLRDFLFYRGSMPQIEESRSILN